MSLGILEILLVLAVFTILGPKRIANLLRSLGRGVHDFVDSLGRDKKNDKKNELSEEERDGEDKARD
jgi:Sec-independent protein translocase protein TatA